MGEKKVKRSGAIPLKLNPKQLAILKKDYGITESELSFLLALYGRNRKHTAELLKKLFPD